MYKPEQKKLICKAFIVAQILIILVSVTGYLGEFNHVLELTSPFKLQYLIMGFCPLFFFLLASRKKWALVSLFCILINLLEIVPWYLPTFGTESAIADRVRVLQSNVLYRNPHYSKVLSLVREEKPDIAVFVEVSEKWAEKLAVLQKTFPYSFTHQDNAKFGTAIYSKLPLKNSYVEDFGGRKTLVTDVKIQGQVVSLIASHLTIPVRDYSFNERKKQLAKLGNYVTKIKQPVLALGDWNITMWSPFYKRFVRQTKLKNARSGFGIVPSWPTTFTLLSIPIDQLLISPEIKVLNIRRGRKVGSDHWPLITDLTIPVSANY